MKDKIDDRKCKVCNKKLTGHSSFYDNHIYQAKGGRMMKDKKDNIIYNLERENRILKEEIKRLNNLFKSQSKRQNDDNSK